MQKNTTCRIEVSEIPVICVAARQNRRKMIGSLGVRNTYGFFNY